uniref:Uncharacterized protein n=1 Tax=Oryza meridionalis TaxID=40149 RepID=A0A0E0D3S6_9ORYZ
MALRGAASRSFLAAVRGRAASASSASRVRAAPAPLPSAPPRRVPPAAFSPFAAASARPMAAAAAMMGSPAAVAARLTGHPSASVRACCELSQGTHFCRTCQDRYTGCHPVQQEQKQRPPGYSWFSSSVQLCCSRVKTHTAGSPRRSAQKHEAATHPPEDVHGHRRPPAVSAGGGVHHHELEEADVVGDKAIVTGELTPSAAVEAAGVPPVHEQDVPLPSPALPLQHHLPLHRPQILPRELRRHPLTSKQKQHQFKFSPFQPRKETAMQCHLVCAVCRRRKHERQL